MADYKQQNDECDSTELGTRLREREEGGGGEYNLRGDRWSGVVDGGSKRSKPDLTKGYRGRVSRKQ